MRSCPRSSTLPVAASMVLVVLVAAPAGAVAASSACEVRKLGAAVREVRALLRCAEPGTPASCASAAAARRATAFAREDVRGGCRTPGDSDAVGLQVSVLVRALDALLRDAATGPSRCTDAQVALLRRTATRIGALLARDAREPDAARLAAGLASERSAFDAAFARAVAKGACNGTMTSSYGWRVADGVVALGAMLFLPPATCPCFTSASIDAAFPPGFFAASGRGGRRCTPAGIVAGVGATDTCTAHDVLIPPQGTLTYDIIRGGAAQIAYDLCILVPDLDPGDTGTCEVEPFTYPNAAPVGQATTPAEAVACIAAVHASEPFAGCP